MSWVTIHMPIFDRQNESKQTFVWDVRNLYDNLAKDTEVWGEHPWKEEL